MQAYTYTFQFLLALFDSEGGLTQPLQSKTSAKVELSRHGCSTIVPTENQFVCLRKVAVVLFQSMLGTNRAFGHSLVSHKGGESVLCLTVVAGTLSL